MKFLFFFLTFFTPALLKSQDFNYIHYDTKEGLAGSTVYSSCQDKDGFMWFATENGLSRYDGTHFKNFTVKDGLPDNEVLKVFADSKGRVWIATFSKELCFYYKGKIHNRENDSLIRKMKFERNVEYIVEDDEHFLGFSFYNAVIIITPTDSVIKYKVSDISNNKTDAAAVYYIEGKILLDLNFTEAFFYDRVNLIWKKYEGYKVPEFGKGFSADSTHLDLKFDKNKKTFNRLSVPGKLLSNPVIRDCVTYLNTTNGTWSADTSKLNTHYLPGKKISSLVEDKEKNLWFTSLGEGVYKLPSQAVRTVLFLPGKGDNDKEIFSIAAYNDHIVAGGEYSRGMLIDKNFKISELNYAHAKSQIKNNPGTNRLYAITSIKSTAAILGFDEFLVKLENDKPLFSSVPTIKSVAKINDDYILVGTSFYAFKMRLIDLQITDTLWRERCTKVFYQNHNYYIGTLKGLYEVRENKTYIYLGYLHPALTRRITDIKAAADSTLWIATSDNGIVAFRGSKVVKAINDSMGLSSNICKTLFINGNALWVGTDKGINKIDIANGAYHITKYSTTDGLPSNTINALYVKDSTVWVGSPAGLTYFNENSISNSSMCNLRLLGITVSGKQVKIDSAIHLPYNNNNIHFEYAGISFRSGGEIIYHYKLTGLDNEWKATTENILDYKSLPAGDYELELYAVNKYGVKSNNIAIQFSIAAPFWKTLWFYLVISAIMIAGISWMFNYRNKKTRQRLEEKNNFQKQFALLEQQALQSQMNPHFIFNCLNSIQQYILTNEKEKANQYLTGFAALIRQTLDISSQKSITVAEEASYLKRYLDMERMRFGDSFDYAITVDNAVKADYIHMPALLLQPYVENSLRHGIRYKTDGEGKVIIDFSIKGNHLYCTISDNGIGRDKAASFKSKQHIEYQSKGMNLTSKRIELLNAVNENKIIVTVTDLKNNDDTAAGTLVEINIPI